MILESKPRPLQAHPEGLFHAVCVDVIDLGLVMTDYQGEKRMVHRIRIMFETDAHDDEGRSRLIGRSFTASLHSKSRLAEFLTNWRGATITPGDQVDLDKLIGSSCLLLVTHVTLRDGRICGQVSGVSQTQRPLAPSGRYNPAAARRRLAESRERNAGPSQQVPVAPAPDAAPDNVPVSQEPHAKADDVGF